MFLKESNFYNMDSALAVCREQKPEPLYEEMCFILGRMGGKRNTKEALTIIVNHLGDVEKAIEFVEREGDDDLWTELVSRCVVNPKLVGDLLQHAGSHSVDTVNLVNQIPSGLLIPNLHKRIMKIFDDIKLQQRLREGCNAVLKADVVNLLNQLNGKLKRGGRWTTLLDASSAAALASGRGRENQRPRERRRLPIVLVLPQAVPRGGGAAVEAAKGLSKVELGSKLALSTPRITQTTTFERKQKVAAEGSRE